MSPRFDVLIDGGFFRSVAADHANQGQALARKARAAITRADATGLRNVVRETCFAHPRLAGHSIGEIRFYEGALPPWAARGQRNSEARYHDSMRSRSFVMRLGQLKDAPTEVKGPLKTVLFELERTGGFKGLPALVEEGLRKQQAGQPLRRQKGVDTLMVLDLVNLAQAHEEHASVLLSGDSDLAPAVSHVVDELGQSVYLLRVPRATGVAPDLRAAVTASIDLDAGRFAETYHVQQQKRRSMTSNAPGKKRLSRHRCR